MKSENSEEVELYRYGFSEASLNTWFNNYEDAKKYLDSRKKHYLLVYKNHYFVCQAPHIESLGLDPKDPDWEKIGYDWVNPTDQKAKLRLQDKLRAAKR